MKASILTAHAKYGFSATTLLRGLRKKAIEGEPGKRKGIAQLSHSIQRFLEGAEIAGIDRTRIKKIYPVLVFLDPAFTAPFLNLVYRPHFDNAGLQQRHRKQITPVHVVTVEGIESTLPYTNGPRFTEILDSFYRGNHGPVGDLSRVDIGILQGAHPGIDKVRQRFRQFSAEMSHDFFPGQAEE